MILCAHAANTWGASSLRATSAWPRWSSASASATSFATCPPTPSRSSAATTATTSSSSDSSSHSSSGANTGEEFAIKIGIENQANLLQVFLSGIDFYLDIPPHCLAAQPILPNSHLHKQNWAENGTYKIELNPTQLSKQTLHPVFTLPSMFTHSH